MKERDNFNLEISEAKPETLKDVIKLVESAKLDPTYLYQSDPLLIATNQNNELIGCAGLERRGNLVHLQSLAVKKELRKKGVGSALVEHAFRFLNDEETMVALTLFWNNDFYKKLGFEKLNAKEVKNRDDVGSRIKHKYCVAWGRKK